MGPAESRFSDILLLRSKLLRSAGLLLLLLFSWPPAVQVVKTGGAVFPLSGPWLRARFIGLLGDVLRVIVGRTGAVFDRPEERSASFALGGKGTARGDGVLGGLPKPWKMVGLDVARLGGDSGDGESGDFGDELGDFLTKLNFDGDRESERRRDLTAELTST